MFLTEQKLGEFLKQLYPSEDFIHDRKVIDSNIKNRVDYQCSNLRLIVEFDGYFHYSVPSVILNDQKKDFTYTNLGYKIVRIPYFVQLSTQVIKELFEIDFKIDQSYPHGFIDEKALLPAAFCELGIQRFLSDLDKFSFIKEDIIDSLFKKVNDLKNQMLVLPPSLLYLLRRD